MTARVATPLPDRYNLQSFPKTPPNSLKLSIPFLQTLHPLPAHLPSLPTKQRVKRSKGTKSNIDLDRRGEYIKEVGYEKTHINVSVIAVSSLEQSGSLSETTSRCKQCRRALYSRDEEQPIQRKGTWALDYLLEDQPEASTSTSSMVVRTVKSKAKAPRESVTISVDNTPLAPSSFKEMLEDPTSLRSPPRRRSLPTPLASPPPPTQSKPSIKSEPIPSSVQLTTFSLPFPDPIPLLRQRHSSPLSGQPSQSTSTSHQPVRRRSCPPCTPLRIQVLEWRMVKCGKLAGVRARSGVRGEGTAGRWDGS